MSFKPNRNDTMYSAHVERCVAYLGSIGAGAWTIKELASCMGMQPTHNLRKRVRTMVENGLLDCHPYYRDRNEHGHFYTMRVTEVPDILDLPF